MNQTYFLGANSTQGFVSLYEDFPPDENVFLHIIKSGPGTGKSGFMKKLAFGAEERGLDVHRVCCSGDPDSLDGVYIPAIGQAWVDGTAPHVVEPRIFGADSDYCNLGAFFRISFEPEELNALRHLTGKYKAEYRDAYTILGGFTMPKQRSSENNGRSPVEMILKELPDTGEKRTIRRRFLSAFTWKGLLQAEDLKGYQLVKTAAEVLESAARQIAAKGWNAILCPSGLDPTRPEAVLLPELRLGFTAFLAEEFRQDPLLIRAAEKLRTAKALHDELEAIYHPHMNFTALDTYTDTLISKLFS